MDEGRPPATPPPWPPPGPPPDRWDEPPPNHWVLPLVVAAVALVPAVFLIVGAATSEDETATGPAGSSVPIMLGFAVVVALVGGLIAWAVTFARTRTSRRVLGAILVVGAAVVGVVVGFVGGVAVALERHPTWDDA